MFRLLENRYFAIFAFTLTIIANGLANALPLNGRSTADVSAAYPSLFTPAGVTFSIWGVIYLSLLGFIIYQVIPSQKSSSILQKIVPIFSVSCFANATWIFAWHYDFIALSLVLMLVLLVCLIAIYRALYSERNAASKSELVFVHFPFSLYLGWISVATIANISALQISSGWDDVLISASDWTLMKLAFAGAIGAAVIMLKRDVVFGLVVAWASFGIALKQVDFPEVSGAAYTLAALALMLVIIQTIKNSRQPAL